MVLPAAAAAATAASKMGTAGATALGLGMGKSDMDLTRDLFKLQMRQAKRLWTADWAENSVRHAEQCLQSAQQHSESQAMATATYFQAEKLTSQGIKLARDQDCRAYEMAWRAEVRESLRDELQNQNNRFNIIMLCDTVCLSCVFSLVADGGPPTDTPPMMLNFYVFCLGLSITLFSISLWCSVIVVRRLHEHTASTLERKLFVQTEDIQRIWQKQLIENKPTGPDVMHLVNRAYEDWVAKYLSPIGNFAIQLLSIGVVTMFITAGILVHNLYLIDYGTHMTVPILFWSSVLITSTTVLFMKFTEDRQEKKKLGVYDISWRDHLTKETGPYAKMTKAAQELSNETAVQMSSIERMNFLASQEKAERDFCPKTKPLHQRVQSLIKEAEQSTRMRKDILQLLTNATEEFDALPEELISSLNKVLYAIDEVDSRTANLVSTQSENVNAEEGSSRIWNQPQLMQTQSKRTMAPHPIDAQRIPVSLGPLRQKLGEVALTTLLRLRNLSDEPLRLKSGVQLKDGRYIKSLNSTDPNSNSVCHQFYPGTEIPARTEVIVVARSGGGWVPTSGIEGEIVYTNKDGSWVFRIKFTNQLMRGVRKIQVKASPPVMSADNTHSANQYWQISKDEIDRKANNEAVISFELLSGGDADKAAIQRHQSQICIKSGFLFRNKASGLKLLWPQRWCELTPVELIWCQHLTSDKSGRLAIKDIVSVKPVSDLVKSNVFEICTKTEDSTVSQKLAAESPEERNDWIRKILLVTGLTSEATASDRNQSSLEPSSSFLNDDIECVNGEDGTRVLPIT